MDFYDRRSRATHYFSDDDTLYTWAGRAVGFRNGENIFDNRGRHIGRLHNGWIRDHSGGAVLFSSGASGGPIPPIPAIPPIKAIPQIPPIRAIPQIPRIPAIPKLGWGAGSLDELLR